MKYEKTCSHGSFKSWGTGFLYSYEVRNTLLDINLPNEQRAVARLKLDDHIARDPLGYVDVLDKTNQIKALMYSNNTTINLADTMDTMRIAPLIGTTSRISRLVQALRFNQFDRFSILFCEEFGLRNIKIKKFFSHQQQHELFLGRMKTSHGNSICVRACTLTGLLMEMSERTLRDLITMEFGHTYNNSAHNLLNASSKLATISRVLDNNFIPADKLKEYESLVKNLDTKRINTPEER